MGGPPRSRARRATTAARLPPALSPATASRAGSAPSSAAWSATHVVTASQSSTAAGIRVFGRQAVVHAHHHGRDAGGQPVTGGVVGGDVADDPPAPVEVDHHRKGGLGGRAVDPDRHRTTRPRHRAVLGGDRLLGRPGQRRQEGVAGPGLLGGLLGQGWAADGSDLVEQGTGLLVEGHGTSRTSDRVGARRYGVRRYSQRRRPRPPARRDAVGLCHDGPGTGEGPDGGAPGGMSWKTWQRRWPWSPAAPPASVGASSRRCSTRGPGW